MAQTKRKIFSVIVDQDLDTSGQEPGQGSAPLSLSEHLKASREGTGLSLREVSDALRIRYVYLQAIEEGRWQDLPGPVYAIGFIRTLSLFLSLDAEEMVHRFKEEERSATSRQDLNFPVAAPEARLSGGVMLLVALLLAGVSYGGWYIWSAQNEEPQVAQVELPDRFATMLADGPPPVDRPVSSTATTGQAQAAELPQEIGPLSSPEREAPESSALEIASQGPPQPPTDAASNAQGPLTTAASGDGQPAATPPAGDAIPEDATVTASAPPTPPPAEPVATASAPARIELRATGDSWVLVRDAEDAMVMTRVMRAGDTYQVPAEPGLTLFTGNAGGLEIVVDGEIAPALGEPGEVVRGIALDANTLLAGNAAR